MGIIHGYQLFQPRENDRGERPELACQVVGLSLRFEATCRGGRWDQNDKGWRHIHSIAETYTLSVVNRGREPWREEVSSCLFGGNGVRGGCVERNFKAIGMALSHPWTNYSIQVWRVGLRGPVEDWWKAIGRRRRRLRRLSEVGVSALRCCIGVVGCKELIGLGRGWEVEGHRPALGLDS